ncbi:MAG: class I SAM-dependent methyltransferase [Rhodobacter sp.]|uniref:cyclopropane-fatty-acyl-phospholipid synthase family protein n=1 Tax=Pararhodobacter sp. TaxID=2127056 RepID=UPI001DA77ECE|nr:cyclopropane-fatty-acyl-phospholipid synthase family protein [Pararhodobacter sp.]MCB1346646.1 class I SAM-dependent methyltransferase [Paracoccaceae bacterium]MCC0074104.1 class I SAM-dependent methyltransferase [Rhodobacter sp.]HPD92368.1 cyclopropane-fatty-acyl-phospholipid synthase family protein [Pararhodobacter sp.]
MEFLTTTDGQSDLPRYFKPVFAQLQGMNYGRLDIVLPDGRRFRAQGREPGQAAEVRVHNPDAFARLIREGDLGFADAYIDGWWSTPDLQAMMDVVFKDNPALLDDFTGMALVRTYERVRHWLRGNSRKQAKKNIAYHYDLGNDFYKLWLDDSMTYSSALFRTGQESLERAQEQKYEALVDSLGLQPGDHVLEIGCGWGGFAEYAAGKRGLKVTGLTISRAQHDFAVARMQRAGLGDKVEIKLQDYRDEVGRYDGIASIEMFEAVGEKYWPTYFNAVRDRLKEGARATIQVITVPNERFATYRKNVDFIQKYIFPGGMLISPARFAHEAQQAGLGWLASIEFGESYSQTLRRWHETFTETWDRIQTLGYDARFKRMWDFYLTSCAGAFHTGICDVTQITLRRPA